LLDCLMFNSQGSKRGKGGHSSREHKNTNSPPAQSPSEPRSSSSRQRPLKSFSFGDGRPVDPPTKKADTQDRLHSEHPQAAVPHYVAFYDTKNHRRSRSVMAVPIPEPQYSNSRRTFSPFRANGHRSPRTGYRKKKVMVDASTQTTNDASTQTDTEMDELATKFKDAATSTSASSYFLPAESSFSPKPSAKRSPEVTIGFGVSLDAEDLMSNIHDLEDEIARLRYRVLSVNESCRWVSREKDLRPTCPVIPLERSKSMPTEDSLFMTNLLETPLTSDNDLSQATLSNSRTLSNDSFVPKPIPKLEVRPVSFSPVITFKQPSEGPDLSKRKPIMSSHSAFTVSTSQRTRTV